MPKILKSLLNFFIADPVRKIFAIIFAFGLWLFVAIEASYVYTRNIRIVYSGLPESYMTVDSLEEIKVSFQGRGRALLVAWLVPPRAVCDLKNARSGENEILTKDLIVPVNDVTINYETRAIKVTIDERSQRTFRVSVPIKGALREGFSISNVVVPDTLSAAGPKEVLADLDEVLTESLDVRNHSESFEEELAITTLAPLVSYSSNIVSVKVEVDTTLERTFTKIPLKVIKLPGQLVTLPQTVLDTLVVAGAKARVEGLKKEDIVIRVKLTKLSAGDYDLPAEIILPAFTKPIYSSPQRFPIKIY